jgi:small-conductance mechanosensitive channel
VCALVASRTIISSVGFLVVSLVRVGGGVGVRGTLVRPLMSFACSLGISDLVVGIIVCACACLSLARVVSWRRSCRAVWRDALGAVGVGTSSFARMLALLVGVCFMVWSVASYWYYVRTLTPTDRHSS